jgi:hypothetical protein
MASLMKTYREKYTNTSVKAQMRATTIKQKKNNNNKKDGVSPPHGYDSGQLTRTPCCRQQQSTTID